jgi:hypothetical protein
MFIRTSQETHYGLSIGLFVPHRKHIMRCLYVSSYLTGNTLRAVYGFVRTSEETHYELSIGP